ncbi:MAG: hypothetical protein ABMB14_33910, partial [Myxococcota bacterium]
TNREPTAFLFATALAAAVGACATPAVLPAPAGLPTTGGPSGESTTSSTGERTPAGTFVGNPNLTARLADNDAQTAVGGSFQALEVHLTDCDVPYVPLGPTTLEFHGATTSDALALVPGDHCGLFFVVDRFVVEFRDGGEDIIVIADNFDLTVAAGFSAELGDLFQLRFGDEAWLAEVGALAGPGESILNGEDPALDAAFYDGLTRGSTVLQIDP